MKIISTVHIIFQNNLPMYLGHKDLKNILSSYESKKNNLNMQTTRILNT